MICRMHWTFDARHCIFLCRYANSITLPCIHMASSTVIFICHKSSDLKLFFVQSCTLSSGGSPPSPYIRVWSWSRFVPVQGRFFYSCCSFRFQALGFFKFCINQVFLSFFFFHRMPTCRGAKHVLLLRWWWHVWRLRAGDGSERLRPLHPQWLPGPMGRHCGGLSWA